MRGALLVLVASASVAHADAPGTSNPAAGLLPPHDEPATEEATELKSPTEALLLSLGGTAGSLALIAAGYHWDRPELLGVGFASSVVTPSLGQFYSGELLTPGLAIRAGGGALALAGVITMMHGSWTEPQDHESEDIGKGLAIAGAAVFAAGAIYDIATAPRAARRHNARRGVAISPAPLASGGFGLAIGGAF